MSKSSIPCRVMKKDANGNRMTVKDKSHGTFRCKRHPNSKRCK